MFEDSTRKKCKPFTQTRFQRNGEWSPRRFLNSERMDVMKRSGYSEEYLCRLEDEERYDEIDCILVREMVLNSLTRDEMTAWGLDEDGNWIEQEAC